MVSLPHFKFILQIFKMYFFLCDLVYFQVMCIIVNVATLMSH